MIEESFVPVGGRQVECFKDFDTDNANYRRIQYKM